MTRAAVAVALAGALGSCGGSRPSTITDGSGRTFVEHGKQLGEPCNRDRTCGGDARCISHECWIECSPSDPCPAGLTCADADDDADGPSECV